MEKYFNKIMGSFSIIIIAIVAFFLISVGSVKIAFNENAFSVKGTSMEITLSYKDIEKIELNSSFSGKRNFGVETLKVKGGTFSNDNYKKFKAYIYKNVDKYIFVYYNDTICVFNLENENKTIEAFNTLKEKIN